jgi:ABC-type branched-subunit amino acid transport system substrate-binding protein
VSAEEILVGQTAALSGPAQALGLGMRTGIQVSFDEVNAAGGVSGRHLRLTSRDDGYEPGRAAGNAKALVEEDKVFALIGSVGTPTTAQVVPVCDAAGVPLVGPFTGAASFRVPYNPRIVNLRASYGQEIERLVALLVDGRDLRKVACLFQNDLYGQSGLKALQVALAKRNLEPVALGSYERNTTAVTPAVLAIAKASPEAVVMVGAYAACAEFIRQSHKLGTGETLYCSISFVGTKALVRALGPEAEGIYISQVVPSAVSAQLPITDSYRAALKKYAPDAEPDWISLEGYLDGQLFATLARAAGPDLTREAFLAAVRASKPMDLGGFKVAFAPDSNQGSNQVFLTQVRGGTVVSIQ